MYKRLAPGKKYTWRELYNIISDRNLTHLIGESDKEWIAKLNNIAPQNPIHLSPTTSQSPPINATTQQPSPIPVAPTSSSQVLLSPALMQHAVPPAQPQPTQGALPLAPVYHTSPALPVPPGVLEHCFKPEKPHTSFESLRAQHIGVDNLFLHQSFQIIRCHHKRKNTREKG